jgi:hypothetical protein
VGRRTSMELDFLSKIASRFRLEWLTRADSTRADSTRADSTAIPINSQVNLAGRVGFAVGTGRCGTHFLAEILKHEPEVAAAHEREPLLETFHRYAKWNNLPIDDEGFLQAMETRIRRDLVRHTFSFESSCHLSLSLRELDERFQAKFILLVRHPRDVVRSHLGKGWYDTPVVQKRPELAPGYQEHERFHHFLGRIVPRGAELEEWNRRTRVGKLAWFWATLNQAVIDQAASLPSERWRLVKLEEFDYPAYEEFARFLGFAPQLTARRFDQIRRARPGIRKPVERAWTEEEWSEFEGYVRPLAERLDYRLTR